MLRKTLVAAAALAGGCSCNHDYDYTFPDPAAPEDPSLTAPTSFGSWLSFDTSPEGDRLTMSYYDRDRGALGWAVGVPAGDEVVWAHEKVDGYPDDAGLDVRDVGQYSSQRTAPDGTVWVASYDATNGGLRVSHRIGPHTWAEPETDDGGSGAPGVGQWASLALDAQGLPVVAHADAARGAIRITRFDGAQWSSVQAYASKAVDDVDDLGNPITRPAGVAQIDLVIQGDELLLAFHDTASTSLHLVRGQGDTFTDEVIDDSGDVGAWPSLWTDGDTVRIAYHDAGRQNLMFAEQQGAGDWSLTRIDDGELRGADTELFERDGEPAILYFDGWDNDQWLAVRSGDAWTTSQVGGAEGAVGFFNEAVQAGGRWWAGSYDHTHDALFLRPL
ncbi:MAG: hypothetical protein R3F59_29555 [Myxococcota bacterium]